MEHPLDKGAKFNARRRTMWAREQKLLFATKSRAQARGWEHTIEVSDIVIPELCPVLGLPLTGIGHDKNAPSVDRIDSSKGYVKGNVKVISREANRLKNNGKIEDFEKIIKYMKESEDAVSHLQHGS